MESVAHGIDTLPGARRRRQCAAANDTDRLAGVVKRGQTLVPSRSIQMGGGCIVLVDVEVEGRARRCAQALRAHPAARSHALPPLCWMDEVGQVGSSEVSECKERAAAPQTRRGASRRSVGAKARHTRPARRPACLSTTAACSRGASKVGCSRREPSASASLAAMRQRSAREGISHERASASGAEVAGPAGKS